jgi:uncharacterized protein YndB with AHSA1/START domain
MQTITVQNTIEAPIETVWEYWTNPTHVIHWNFASTDWHCPNATSDFKVGGEFHYIMAAKDGSVSFDFCGTYTKIDTKSTIQLFLEDGREVNLQFIKDGDATKLIETFEPEEVNSLELQQQGWQAILNNFKSYVEG